MSETLELEAENPIGAQLDAPGKQDKGPWQREPGRRGRLSKEERAAKAAWEGETVEFDAPKAKSSNPKRVTSLEQISQMIFTLHSGLSLFASEFAIGKEEADLLAASVANVGKYYNISIDGKTGAILGLISTCGMVYAPRGLAIYLRLRGARNETEANIATFAA